MASHVFFLLRRPNTGSALVTTLLVIVVLTIIVTAFLQSMTLEQQTARSYMNRCRAELAARAGLNLLGNQLCGATRNDTFLIVRSGNDDYLGTPSSSGSSTALGPARYIPLFSFANTVEDQLAGAETLSKVEATILPERPPLQGSDKAKFHKVSPTDGDVETSWIYLFDAKKQRIARFAFWAQDRAASIDATVAGNLAKGSAHERKDGYDPEEVALYTPFDPKAVQDPGNTPAKDLIQNRALLFTDATLRQVVTDPAKTEPLKWFTVHLAEDSEQEIIPLGFGYADEGQPKADLNALVAAADMDKIAITITHNLDHFEIARKGGFTGDYTRTLAANIIDYADADSDPTTTGEIRGVDSFPYLNESFDRNTATWPSGGNNDVVVHVEPFLELWNPSNQTISGTARIEYDLSGQKVTINGTSRALDNVSFTGEMTLPPNGFKVISLGVKDFSFSWGATPPPSNASISMPAPAKRLSMRLFWNGKLADRASTASGTGGGLDRYSSNITRTGANVNLWRGNGVQPNDYSLGQTGDPRADFYLNAYWYSHIYSGGSANTSWGGRNALRDESGAAYDQVKPSVWPDQGTDSKLGVAATSPTDTPILAAQRAGANEPDKAPVFISNAGKYQSITELGNIFDPAQWKTNLSSFKATGAASDLPTTSTPANSAGGGITLAIGRREFSVFDKDGARASQLTDLFTTISRRNTRGLVNLNTATRETLRALAAGIRLEKSDTVTSTGLGYLSPTEIDPPTSSDQADLFADAVIAFRPFYSRSQLNQISTKARTSAEFKLRDNKFAGNPKAWPVGGPNNGPKVEMKVFPADHGVTSISSGWNDRAAEALIARLYDLTTVRSRNFQVRVIGQSLDPNGRVLASVARLYHVFISPNRDSSGAIIQPKLQILYEIPL